MTAGGIEVTTDTLRQHASRVQSVVADVSTARSAAGSADLHGGAFGVLCAFLPPVVGIVEGAALDALGAIHEALSGTVDELRDMARTFDEVDQRVQSHLDGLAKGLPR